MSKTRLTQNSGPIISCSVLPNFYHSQKISHRSPNFFSRCESKNLFKRAGAEWWKPLNDPLTRIIVKSLFSFVYLVIKINQTLISPKLLHIYCFLSKPWSWFSSTRLVVQNMSNHLLATYQPNEIFNLSDVKSRFSIHFSEQKWTKCQQDSALKFVYTVKIKRFDITISFSKRLFF